MTKRPDGFTFQNQTKEDPDRMARSRKRGGKRRAVVVSATKAMDRRKDERTR